MNEEISETNWWMNQLRQQATHQLSSFLFENEKWSFVDGLIALAASSVIWKTFGFSMKEMKAGGAAKQKQINLFVFVGRSSWRHQQIKFN